MEQSSAFDSASVRHEDEKRRGSFYIEADGETVASMTYHRLHPGKITIGHTEVDDEYSGQGVGRLLLDALVSWVRSTGDRVDPKCPYARAQFERDASIRDVLA